MNEVSLPGAPVGAQHNLLREVPALPENKASLLFLSFAFPGKSISSCFKLLSLADLRPVHLITRWRLADLAAFARLSSKLAFLLPFGSGG